MGEVLILICVTLNVLVHVELYSSLYFKKLFLKLNLWCTKTAYSKTSTHMSDLI